MTDTDKQPTFLFHDYETFGTHPALDRPAQFAAIRTDNEFNVIGEPEVFTASPRMTIYPSPSSINYRYYPAGGTGERRKRSRVCRPYSLAFTVPKTCILGYNNVRFDDEVTRNVFIVISTILTHGAGSMITRAGIYWMLCVPVMPCARKE